MIYIVNILTVILAVVFSLQLSNEKKAYLYSALFIVFGIGFHLLEAYINYTSEKCSFNQAIGIFDNIDNCIEYDSGSMIVSQAIILAGFTVLFMKLATRTKPNK